ncbi:TetR/AcrR family transcriptional regulator [Fodinicola acaciae]|uniref:TetR/AcrR family transcriptional regulator n=1 Tax=Fodinicola acaciae TaxID=2681555 RepID=UPI0013D782D1|nr:TetR/AcrR family transcriptional regulator [Fodinicola acaciae]
MGRHPDPDRRAALLTAAARYLERHGLAGLSLRPLAAALDTTARTLLYHFGSKERLIDEALSESRERSPLRAILDSEPTGSFQDVIVGIMAQVWEKSTTDPARSFLLLFYETYAAALRNPADYGDFLGHVVAEWHDPFAAAIEANGVPKDAARSFATRAIGTHRGLLLDRLGCSDPERVDAAHRDFLRQCGEELTGLLSR